MAPRAKYEWQVFGGQFRDLEAELNLRDAEGWEAAFVLPGAKKGTCVAVFRRPATSDRPRSSETDTKTRLKRLS